MRVLLLLSALLTLPANAWTLRSTGMGGWSGNTLTVYYNLTGCSMPAADLLSIIDGGIAIWNASQNSGLRIVRNSTPSTGTSAEIVAGTASPTPLITCDTGFTATQSADGDVIPALTRLATTGGRVSFAGIVFNCESGKQANIGVLTSSEVSVAFTHELGHALGLGHSSDVQALMYYSISGKTSAVLTQDDMDGIAYLYPRNEFSNGPYGCASSHRPASARGGLWLALLLVLNWFLGRWAIRFRPKPLL